MIHRQTEFEVRPQDEAKANLVVKAHQKEQICFRFRDKGVCTKTNCKFKHEAPKESSQTKQKPNSEQKQKKPVAFATKRATRRVCAIRRQRQSWLWRKQREQPDTTMEEEDPCPFLSAALLLLILLTVSGVASACSSMREQF